MNNGTLRGGSAMASEGIPAWAPDVAAAILQNVLVKDPFTFYHCCRVGRAARKLGKVMGMPEFEQAVLEYSGLLHDVGKVGIPDNVLLKPARLTKEEYDLMKSHAEKSVAIIRPLTNNSFFRFLVPGIRYHHERFDGKGYPFGLKGEKIPLPARIISVVDTVDAMMNTRPYRKGLTLDVVKEELVNCSGTQFDTNIVKAYLDALPHWDDLDKETADEVVVAAVLKAA